jgi:diguanylate cyclase (GGDEF)-like protein
MYRKIKASIFSLLFLSLWLRFFLMLWDPHFSGTSLDQGLPIYRDWRNTLDWLYALTNYPMMPIWGLYGWFAPLIPKIPYFPGFYTITILQNLYKAAMSAESSVGWLKPVVQLPFLRQLMLGYGDLTVLIALAAYRLFEPLPDIIFNFFKNVIWNIIIEYSFTKRKEATYQNALGQRAADLVKLNVEYKNLSNEASILAVSVVTDELTKAYNKRFFIEKMTYEFKIAKEKKQILSVAMLDIDHFKKLNDTYGHLFGDKVLQAVAQVARKGTPKDSFCCRFGGEEFAIIMPGKSLAEAKEIVGEIHKSLPLLRFEDDMNLRTAASFGICWVNFACAEAQELQNFEGMLKLSDDELYRAKLNGRNRIEVKVIE